MLPYVCDLCLGTKIFLLELGKREARGARMRGPLFLFQKSLVYHFPLCCLLAVAYLVGLSVELLIVDGWRLHAHIANGL